VPGLHDGYSLYENNHYETNSKLPGGEREREREK
jgi:hypothetical protein